MVKRKRRSFQKPPKFKPELRTESFTTQYDIENIKKPLTVSAVVVAAFAIVYFVILPWFNSPADLVIDIPKTGTATQEIKTVGVELVPVVTILNGCGVRGIADRLTTFLKDNNIRVYEAKNADNFNYKETTIINQDPVRNFAKDVSGLLECNNIKFQNIESDSANVVIILGSDYNKFKPFTSK